MEMNIFDFLTGLEQDIAHFYRRLLSMGIFPRSQEIFQYMVKHSEGHSQEVATLRERHKKPQLDNNFFYELHTTIGKSLLNDIGKGMGFREAIDRIAKTEEQVGKMYQLLAGHYRTLAEYYQKIAAEIDHLSQEENMHRDLVYKEAAKY